MQLEVRQTAYRGWKECIEIHNESIRIVIVPQIGRIMHYGLLEGPNLIWINSGLEGRLLGELESHLESRDAQWANFGGDKVWPVEQFRWPEVNNRAWPPDPWFDGSPQEVITRSDGVTLMSPVSRFCGARIIRTIKIDEIGNSVKIEQRIEKVKSGFNSKIEPIPLTIWSVTQVIQPEEIIFPLNPNSSLPNSIFIYDENPVTRSNIVYQNGLGIFFPSSTDHQKIGTDGDQWLAAVCGCHAFVQRFTRLPNAVYPENGLSAEVYTSPESYIELEILSPLQSMKVGESIESTIFWELISLTSDTPDEKRQEIRKILGK